MAPGKDIGIEDHYEFGANWARFVHTVSERTIAEARRGLERLFPAQEIVGKRFLDIGCGSGLHSLAALELGAAEVVAIDIDPDSVATAEALLQRFAPSKRWRTEIQSIFDVPDDPKYDIVYSWGVLHHTGNMHGAIKKAAAMATAGGLICLALYRKTPLCQFWRLEKRYYVLAPNNVRRVLEGLYLLAMRITFAARGQKFDAYVGNYCHSRGMDFMTDVRDWLGGYPYESVSEIEMLQIAESFGLENVRRFCHKPGRGLLGTGCDEYVFRRPL